MAIGTMLVVAVAVLGSLTVLPAVLSLLGDKVDRPRIPLRAPAASGNGHGAGRFWPAVMRVVLAKPLVSLVIAGAALMALAVPALGMTPRGERRGLAAALDPDPADLRRDDRGVPADGFAHTVVVWSEDGSPLHRAAVRHGVAAMLASRRRSRAGSPTCRDSHVDVRTGRADGNGRRPMTGDFNTDRAKASLTLLRDDLAPALQHRLPGHRGRRHR